jgi:hypothetical protein
MKSRKIGLGSYKLQPWNDTVGHVILPGPLNGRNNNSSTWSIQLQATTKINSSIESMVKENYIRSYTSAEKISLLTSPVEASKTSSLPISTFSSEKSPCFLCLFVTFSWITTAIRSAGQVNLLETHCPPWQP